MTLAIATGDDPEADSAVDERMQHKNASSSSPAPRRSAPAPAENAAYICQDCGAAITQGIHKVSLSKFQRPLCMNCQKKSLQIA